MQQDLNKQRQDAFTAREALPAAARAAMSAAITERFLKDVPLPHKGGVISLYSPVNGEVDVRPLRQRLHDMGYVCALPQVLDTENRLSFRTWRPETPMQVNLYGMEEPVSKGTEDILPDMLVMPGLAFDRSGGRVGHGARHFEGTFRFLKEIKHAFVTVGVAFDMQMVEKALAGPQDQPMDMIVTEQNVYRRPSCLS